ncbi:hypothetical protein DL96DRAFT_1472390 [Flagelloscypha sp. PMI_526]|nr:hypothetical protein DL96DRAFT_1472390 [Flagelloscypha sp. PMI_526]
MVVSSEDYYEPPSHSDDANTKDSPQDKASSADKNSSEYKWTTSTEFSRLVDEGGWREPGTWWRIVSHSFMGFFCPSFADDKTEDEFRRLFWSQTKTPARLASGYLVLNWMLYLILNKSNTAYRRYAYGGGLTIFTIPVFFMVIFDMPAHASQRVRTFFQIWLCIATWYCGVLELIETHVCEFFVHGACNGKDFLAMMYYITAVPALMMFVCSKRIYNLVAQLVTLVLLCVLILPIQDVFSRNVVSYIVFSMFIQWLHYKREEAERNIFRLQVKVNRALGNVKKARKAETLAAEAKQQFSSYIFHEVRVPLNAAVIAFQNLIEEGALQTNGNSNVVADARAVEAGFHVMGQILNDTLSLHQMQQSFSFKLTNRAFPLHTVIKSSLGGFGPKLEEKRLKLQLSLDPKLDQVFTEKHIQFTGGEDAGLWVFADELRLRQVLSNLMSNAIKFSPEGGREIECSTQLLFPLPDQIVDRDEPSALLQRARAATEQGEDVIVWRMEVHDSGPGIRPSDLLYTSLFQPFVQTSVGKKSGTGSGLGLAIIKTIVEKCGGRLGIRSQHQDGATFWVEFLYRVAKEPQIAKSRERFSTVASAPPPLHMDQIIELRKPMFTSALTVSETETMTLNNTSIAGGSPLGTPKDGIIDSMTDPLAQTPTTPVPAPIPVSILRTSAATSKPPLIRTSSTTSHAPPVRLNPDPPALPSESAPLEVLFVDDDPMTRRVLSQWLGRRGCNVTTVDDGDQCLKLVLHETQPMYYDLIIMDNQMERLSGEDTVRRLRAAGRRDLYIIGCTGSALEEDRERFSKAGCNDILTKPLHFSDGLLTGHLQAAQALRSERILEAHANAAEELVGQNQEAS